MRRRRGLEEEGEENSSDRWLVSYADFITLLFAFFVILFATSEKNFKNEKGFQESVKKYLVKFGAFGGSGGKVHQGEKATSVLDSPIKKFNRNSKDVDKLQYKVETFLEENMSQEELKKVISDISPEAVGVRISISGEKLFPGNTSQLNKASFSLLNKLAKLIKEVDYRIFIEGHVSEGNRNSRYNNSWALASQRAVTVTRFLQKVHKVEAKRMVALSYGDEKPLFKSSGEQAQKNNRIDILLITEDFPL